MTGRFGRFGEFSFLKVCSLRSQIFPRSCLSFVDFFAGDSEATSDHDTSNTVENGNLRTVAILTSDLKKIRLKVMTSYPCVHVYSGTCLLVVVFVVVDDI